MKPRRDEKPKAIYEWRDNFHLADKMDAQACGEVVDYVAAMHGNTRTVDKKIAEQARAKEKHPFRPAITTDREQAIQKLNVIEVRNVRQQLRISELIESVYKPSPATEEGQKLDKLIEEVNTYGLPGKAHRSVAGKILRMDDILADDNRRAALLDRMQSQISAFKAQLANFRDLERLIQPLEALEAEIKRSRNQPPATGDSARQ